MASLLARLTIDNALQGPAPQALQGSAKTVMKKNKSQRKASNRIVVDNQ